MRRFATVSYVVWCVAIAAGFLLATQYAWSPFASGGRPLAGTGAAGPQHK